jgi:hypothetical protein
LVLVLVYLPFVQTRFAVENRLRAGFEVRATRRVFRGAPLAFLLALVLTLALAVPLHLLKIQMIPRDAAWMACLVFVMMTWPTKLAIGWAYGRGVRHPQPRSIVTRILSRVAILSLAAIYVGLLFPTILTSWYGLESLYAQHPFLVPVPFFQFDSDLATRGR